MCKDWITPIWKKLYFGIFVSFFVMWLNHGAPPFYSDSPLLYFCLDPPRMKMRRMRWLPARGVEGASHQSLLVRSRWCHPDRKVRFFVETLFSRTIAQVVKSFLNWNASKICAVSCDIQSVCLYVNIFSTWWFLPMHFTLSQYIWFNGTYFVLCIDPLQVHFVMNASSPASWPPIASWIIFLHSLNRLEGSLPPPMSSPSWLYSVPWFCSEGSWPPPLYSPSWLYGVPWFCFEGSWSPLCPRRVGLGQLPRVG